MKFLERIIPHPAYLASFIILQRTLTPNYQTRNCKKCQRRFYVKKRDYVEKYFGATKQRLCPICFAKANKTTVQRNVDKKKLRASSQYRNPLTHTTPKRRAFDTLDEIINYMTKGSLYE